MFRRQRREAHTHRRRYQRLNIGAFLKRPSFQIGVVIFTIIVVVLIALIGKPADKPNQALKPTGSAPTQPPGTSLPGVVSVNTAHELYMSNAVYLLDVRERAEWDQFHIPNSTLLPLSQVAGLVDKFPRDKPIILISASDNRSQQARDILKAAGFTNVSSMAGGIIFWQTQGYPIEP